MKIRVKRKTPDAGQNAEGCIERCALAVGTTPPGPGQNGEAKHTQGQRQMGREYVESEEVVVGGGQPIRQRRFFQIADAIHFQGDPVAAARHILGSSRREWHRRHPARGAHRAPPHGPRRRPAAAASRLAPERGRSYFREAPRGKERSDSTWLKKARQLSSRIPASPAVRLISPRLADAFNAAVAQCAQDADPDAVHRVRTGSRRLQAMLEATLRETPGAGIGATGSGLAAATEADSPGCRRGARSGCASQATGKLGGKAGQRFWPAHPRKRTGGNA